MHLTDLTFIEDGNPDVVNGLINFKKREMLYKAIWNVRKYRMDPYTFERKEPLHSLLQELPHADENTLFALSLFQEPREPKPSASSSTTVQ